MKVTGVLLGLLAGLVLTCAVVAVLLLAIRPNGGQLREAATNEHEPST